MIPLPLRVGDFNQDGYPDILFLLSNSTAAPSTGGLFGGSHRRSGIQPKLLESVACRKNRRECWGKVEKGRRTFNDATAHHRSLDDIWDGERVAWLDIDDDVSAPPCSDLLTFLGLPGYPYPAIRGAGWPAFQFHREQYVS